MRWCEGRSRGVVVMGIVDGEAAGVGSGVGLGLVERTQSGVVSHRNLNFLGRSSSNFKNSSALLWNGALNILRGT